MILFTKENAQKVVDGTKTQTRRFWKNQRMSSGKHYYAQTSLKPKDRFARLLCLDCWQWDGETISDQDAIAEGYSSGQEFLSVYNQLNKNRLEDNLVFQDRQHYAIKFQIIEHYKEDSVVLYHYKTYDSSTLFDVVTADKFHDN